MNCLAFRLGGRCRIGVVLSLSAALGLTAQEKGETLATPIKRSDVELLHPIADGTPPPPKPPIVVTPPARVQEVEIYAMRDRTMTMKRVKPSEAVPIPKPEPVPTPPARELTETERKQWEEAMRNYTQFNLSATFYEEQQVSFLRWSHDKKRYYCWSNIPFTHVAGVGSFKVRGHHYSLFMGIGVERVRVALEDVAPEDMGRVFLIDPNQWPGVPPKMPEWPPQFEMMGEEPRNKAALAPMIAIHEMYAIEHKKLEEAYEGRERYRKEREAWLKENPPKPPSTLVYHWPGKGGSVLEELPPPTLGIIPVAGKDQAKAFRRFGQAEIPKDPAERAALQARAKRAAEALDALENAVSKDMKAPQPNKN